MEMNKEKVKEALRLLSEVEKDLDNKGYLIFKTYYHKVYLNDIIEELENVLINENEPNYWGY